jgi:hypothetical protein
LVGREIGADLADVADGGGRAGACFGDLGLGQGGFRARIGVSEMWTRSGTAGEVMCCGRDVAAAQRDHAENAVRGRGIPVRPEGLGGGQGRLAFGGCVAQPAVRQVRAGAQDRGHRVCWDAVQRLVVCGPDDARRLIELTQVH